METFYQISIFMMENAFAQYFLVGAAGAFFYNLTIYFNPNLGISTKKKGEHISRRFGIIYVVCNTIYSTTLGGTLAMYINHAPWLAFSVGFVHSTFIEFVVKTFRHNSSRKAFWFAIGKLLATILINPTRSFLGMLEVFNTKEETKNDK